MIFYIIIGVIIAAISFAIYKAQKHSKKAGYFDGFPIAMTALISTMLLLFYFLGCSMSWDSDEGSSTESRQDIDIVAMGNSTSLEGKYRGGIFASYGTLNSTQVISYVTKDENGGLHLNKVDADNATVYEQDGDPHISIVRYTEHVDYSFWVPWMVGDRDGGTHTQLYVPKGSVSTEFSLDPNK